MLAAPPVCSAIDRSIDSSSAGLRMRIERVDRHAVAVRGVDDGARLRRPESFADEDERFAPVLLFAEPSRERLQRGRHDLRARRLGRFRVAAHEVALELGARRVVAGVSLERGDHLADERAILREGDRVQRIERLHERDRVAVAKLRVDETGSARRARASSRRPAAREIRRERCR